MEIIAKILGESKIIAKIEKTAKISVRLENAVISSGDAELYDGQYTVIPSAQEQTLPTGNKKMREDVRILAIPTYEVENEAGGKTFIIGG